MLIDTHSHIYESDYDADRAEVIASAKAAGVGHIILANVDSTTIEPMQRTYALDPSYFSMAMGLHPTSVNEHYSDQLDRIQQELSQGIYHAVGEIGLDFYWDTTFKVEQEIVFAKQIEMAIEYNLPMILHIRKAYAEIFSILNRYRGSNLRGVFHCFGGGIEEAKKAISMGFMLGIGGVLTYKNSGLRDIVSQIGLDSLILETDAPYLSPVPYRGKRNEPKYMVAVCDMLSDILDVPSEVVSERSTDNAQRLFNI